MGALKIEDVAYTYDDYKMWEGDWELLDGVPIAMAPAPMINHQMIASAIISEIYEQLDDCPSCVVLGEVDYKISDNTILRPDVVLTCDEDNEAYLVKAPQIVVEIASKSTVKRDETYKFDIYEAEKVKYYVIVYPDDLVAKVYKLDDKKYDKQGDFTKESYEFKDTLCKVVVNFEKVFRRFRKR
jgi:Uma2 family endonuclease